MTKRKKPINIAEKLKQRFKQTELEPKDNDLWINLKSLGYTAAIGTILAITTVSGLILTPIVIILIVGLIIFSFVKHSLTKKDEEEDE
jgi:hypothetical protein